MKSGKGGGVDKTGQEWIPIDGNGQSFSVRHAISIICSFRLDCAFSKAFSEKFETMGMLLFIVVVMMMMFSPLQLAHNKTIKK